MKKRNIKNIINHINSTKDGQSAKKGICILLGAGADLSSGGILFKELKIRFLRENGYDIPHNITEKKLNERFEECLVDFSRDERCETLEKIMKRSSLPSEGYQLMVLLAQLGYINAIITTNFDYLLEETEELLNIKPFSVYAPGIAIPDDFYSKRNKTMPLYLKMHGDLYGRLVTHLTQTEIESKKYGVEFINLFLHIIQNNTIIAVGYGGFDDLITQLVIQEMSHIDHVYWCNIAMPDKGSSLADALEENGKLVFVETSFDNLFQEISHSILSEEKLIDSNPIFLPTILQSKMDNQKKLFENKLISSEIIIERTGAKKNIDLFFQGFDQKCIIIKGESQSGKTYFIYKSVLAIPDIKFIPIFYDGNKSFLENMALALGYKTDVPFSLMYHFSNWCNVQKTHIVFIIDGFFNDNYDINSNYKYILELFNFINVTIEHKNIQFVLSFQEKIYSELKRKCYKTYRTFFESVVNVGPFDNKEVNKLLIKYKISAENLAPNIYELLHKPYMWNIISKKPQVFLQQTDVEFFNTYINELYQGIESPNFTKHSLHQIIRLLSYKQVFAPDIVIDINDEKIQFLIRKGILNVEGNPISYEMSIFLCADYILGNDEWEDIVENDIISNLKNKHTITNEQLDVYVSILCCIKEIDDIKQVVAWLEKILDLNIGLVKTKLVLRTLVKLLKEKAELFKKYLCNIYLSIYTKDLQNCIFKTCAEYDKDLLSIWETSKNATLSYNAFVLNNDYIYQKMLGIANNSVHDNELDGLFNECAVERKYLMFLHLLSYFGWDNTRQYGAFLKGYKEKLIPYISCCKEDEISAMVELLKKYSFNIFFNAGEDFEERFSNAIRMEEFQEIIKNVLEGKSLDILEYKYLLKVTEDYNNSWIFLISNIIFIQSMRNDFEKAYSILREVLQQIGENITVQQLDYYLSSAFWALYLNKPYDRECFVEIFQKVRLNYERLIFSFPNNPRYASIQKFSQEIDWIFEDGFNPIAFYFYTAPSKNIIQKQDKEEKDDKEITELSIYWELAEILHESGHYNDILRIVHALGQMISIFPEQGYRALEKLAIYDHPTITKGVIRILKENYIRYPKVTQAYMSLTAFQFEDFEKEDIIYNTNSLLQNRTFEQLHWARLFYNIKELFQVDLCEVFLTNFTTCDSCNSFLKNMLSSIFKY